MKSLWLIYFGGICTCCSRNTCCCTCCSLASASIDFIFQISLLIKRTGRCHKDSHLKKEGICLQNFLIIIHYKFSCLAFKIQANITETYSFLSAFLASHCNYNIFLETKNNYVKTNCSWYLNEICK